MNIKLAQLGVECGTDKSGFTGTHTFNGRSFLDDYERYFKFLKDKNISFLELGVLDGKSLEVWQKYFTEAKIVGLDIDPDKKRHEKERIKIYTGSQDDKVIIDQIKLDYPGKFAIILDDASHINDLTIKSFDLLFDHVLPGGMYIIEDTHCTYGAELLGSNFINDARSWPGMKYNNDSINYNNDRKTFLNFVIPKIQEMDNRKGNIFAMHFYSETLIIEKCR